MAGGGPDVAAVGDEFLVVATHEPTLHYRFVYTMRVRGSDGALLDAAPIQRTGSYDTQVAVAAFSDRWVLAYAHTVTHNSPYATIRFMIIQPWGGATQPTLGGDGGFTNNEPTLATDGNQALLAWTSGGDVRARRLLSDGSTLDTDLGLAVSTANNMQFAPSVGWNGVDFALGFSDYRIHTNVLDTGIGDVYECRVDVNGTVLEPAGVPLATSPKIPEGQASVAGGAGISVIAHSALRVEAQYGTWRIVLDTSAPPLGVYCTAKTNSLGCVPAIAWSGAPQAGATSGFTISAAAIRNNSNGLLLFGLDGSNTLPFRGGTMCVKTPLNRSPLRNSGGTPTGADCSGVFSMDFNAFASGAAGGSPNSALLQSGTVVHVQWWGRDNGFTSPNNVTLSDALRFTL